MQSSARLLRAGANAAAVSASIDRSALDTSAIEALMANPARGDVTINTEECKGCGLCVESCPPKVLELLPELNVYGAHPAHYKGEACTGCGICFYCCPEPGAITVFRIDPGQVAKAAAKEETYAATV
jgi:2-oxoglutarate ferredoxin oxidoreductase subunit delta